MENYDDKLSWKATWTIRLSLWGVITVILFCAIYQYRSINAYLSGNQARSVESIDFFSFRVLSKTFAKDRHYVYANGIIIPADPDTFRIIREIGENYGCDPSVCFLEGDIWARIDPATYTRLTHGYARDKDHIYYREKTPIDADADTFKIFDENIASDDKYVFIKGRRTTDHRAHYSLRRDEFETADPLFFRLSLDKVSYRDKCFLYILEDWERTLKMKRINPRDAPFCDQ